MVTKITQQSSIATMASLVLFLAKWIFIAWLFSTLIDIIWFLDLNKRVYNHRPGKCERVDGPIFGSEDIEYLDGLAFITSGIFYMHERQNLESGIFLYDFNDSTTKNKTTKVVLKNCPSNFHPHGISSWTENEKIFFYVISHSIPEFKHSIEVFEYNEANKYEMIHRKTLKHPGFVRPNDLYVVGKDQFIFTNDGTAQTSLLNAAEMFFGLKAGSVGYYDGTAVHWLVERAKSPNGIWVDLKKKVLFYASPNAETIDVLKLANDFKSASPISQVYLLTSPDNLFMDDDGDLWTAGHPTMSSLSSLENCEHAPTTGQRAPSQVLRIRFSEDYKTSEVFEPYTDDGRQLPCSSVAVTNSKNRLLIGSVAAELVHCEYSEETI